MKNLDDGEKRGRQVCLDGMSKQHRHGFLDSMPDELREIAANDSGDRDNASRGLLHFAQNCGNFGNQKTNGKKNQRDSKRSQ